MIGSATTRFCLLVMFLILAHSDAAEKWQSHTPLRALPIASGDPLAREIAFFVDSAQGDDAALGSVEKPWKSVARGIRDLKPGGTLVLRGGVYHERVVLKLLGDRDQPITIRSYPGELPVFDGGLAEFRENPAKSWEPVPDGAKGEFRSTNTFAGLGPLVHGHFANSLIPLHGYRHRTDMNSDNGYWTVKDKLNENEPFNAGPGVWYDAKTQRIHCRLAHTTVKQLGDDNYRGETDPRKLPLVIAGAGVPLTIDGSKHLRLRGLVIRGGSRATVEIVKSEGIDLDQVTVLGASPALKLAEVKGLKVTRSAIRGISAPWSSRAGHKYRGASAYLILASPTPSPCQDVEFDRCELTDSHDGPYVGTIKNLKIHHCLIDNFNDDGIYLTAAGVGGPVEIYQNVITRCLHCFSFAGKYEAGAGVSIYRNVFDLRRSVPYQWPVTPDEPEFVSKVAGETHRFPWAGRFAGDHGSPTWEPMRIYHNTVVYRTPAFRQAYGCGLGGHVNTKRSVFNNIFVELEGMPGLEFTTTDDKLFEGDGNLHWSTSQEFKGDWFAKFRSTPRFAKSKAHYPSGWASNDLYADPLFAKLVSNERTPLDVSLTEKSPARDAGIAIPAEWPDSLRTKDAGKPDLGAIPAGMKMWSVGTPVR